MLWSAVAGVGWSAVAGVGGQQWRELGAVVSSGGSWVLCSAVAGIGWSAVAEVGGQQWRELGAVVSSGGRWVLWSAVAEGGCCGQQWREQAVQVVSQQLAADRRALRDVFIDSLPSPQRLHRCDKSVSKEQVPSLPSCAAKDTGHKPAGNLLSGYSWSRAT